MTSKRYKQVDAEQWNEAGLPFYLCTLNISPEEFHRQYNIQFSVKEIEGFGSQLITFIESNGIVFNLFAPLIEEDEFESEMREVNDDLNVSVQIQSHENDSQVAFNQLLEALELSHEHVVFKANDLGPAQWSLHRLDDNANEVEMFRFLEEFSANLVRDSYEKKGHKQIYTVVKLEL